MISMPAALFEHRQAARLGLAQYACRYPLQLPPFTLQILNNISWDFQRASLDKRRPLKFAIAVISQRRPDRLSVYRKVLKALAWLGFGCCRVVYWMFSRSSHNF